MKLLRVIFSMDPKSGGPCQGIRNAIPNLKKLGVYNEVVCLDAPTSSYLGKDSFKIHALGPAKRPWGYSQTFIPWLIKNSENYDAVIVHGLWQFSSYAVYKAISTLKKGGNEVPYYVMPHGMLDPYFQKAPERRLKAIRNWFYWKLIEGKVVNQSNGVLFTCKEELLLARETFTPYSPKKELNVGYGIIAPPVYEDEMKQAFIEKCPGVEGKPYFLFLSRIHHKKGVDLLIKAYKDWISKVEEKNQIALVIAGPGMDTAFGESLNEVIAGDVLLSKNVFFPGMLGGNSKWGAFYGCEAFVLPSHQENFGIAIVEALACQKAVLITDKVNIWREIKEENAGFIDSDTLAGTATLLEKWTAQSSSEKLKTHKNAKATFEKYFAIGPATEKFKEALLSQTNI